VTSEFVWRLEAVLDLYGAPPDPTRPVICLDEYPLALQSTPRGDLPCASHRPRREDYEYDRHGRASLFIVFNPATGWREIVVLERHRRREFAAVIQRLTTVHYPEATEIRLVCDNLNTHTPAAFYEVCSPEEARALTERVSFHYTPKHGSWLNMAEIEWAILTRECLGRRLPDKATVQTEVDAWVAARNAAQATVHWRFTTKDARRWLQRCYPNHVASNPS
jgi:transposase